MNSSLDVCLCKTEHETPDDVDAWYSILIKPCREALQPKVRPTYGRRKDRIAWLRCVVTAFRLFQNEQGIPEISFLDALQGVTPGVDTLIAVEV